MIANDITSQWYSPNWNCLHRRSSETNTFCRWWLWRSGSGACSRSPVYLGSENGSLSSSAPLLLISISEPVWVPVKGRWVLIKSSIDVGELQGVHREQNHFLSIPPSDLIRNSSKRHSSLWRVPAATAFCCGRLIATNSVRSGFCKNFAATNNYL